MFPAPRCKRAGRSKSVEIAPTVPPMSVCCDPSRDAAPPPSSGVLTVALAGNPNSGKTTIFNALTGLRQKVANYPGVTVEKKTGRCKLPTTAGGSTSSTCPAPTASSAARPTSRSRWKSSAGCGRTRKSPDVVIVVVDASNLQRNLYLVSQLIELGRPMVVALNMMDVAERRGLTRLARNICNASSACRSSRSSATSSKGIDELKAAIAKAAVAPLPDWPLPRGDEGRTAARRRRAGDPRQRSGRTSEEYPRRGKRRTSRTAPAGACLFA